MERIQYDLVLFNCAISFAYLKNGRKVQCGRSSDLGEN